MLIYRPYIKVSVPSRCTPSSLSTLSSYSQLKDGMAATPYSEKDAPLKTSDDGLPNGAYTLDQRRRAALAEVDNATFS